MASDGSSPSSSGVSKHELAAAVLAPRTLPALPETLELLALSAGAATLIIAPRFHGVMSQRHASFSTHAAGHAVAFAAASVRAEAPGGLEAAGEGTTAASVPVGERERTFVPMGEREWTGAAVITCGGESRTEGVRRSPKQSEAIQSNPKQSEAIRSKQRPSEAIRGNQR